MKILITGAFGQIGTELTTALRARHGAENVLATGRHLPESGSSSAAEGPTAKVDVTDREALADVVKQNEVDVVYHLAARLSVVGEQDPQATWRVNMDGLYNVLEVARTASVSRVFWPSSIAAFGPETPRDRTPQLTIMRPTTVYGVSKVAGELLCDYYLHKYGLDVRGVRYPGVISSEALPGGGTTDYAVEVFHAALKTGRYTCFVREDTALPMIYMPDCIKAAMDLMEADLTRLNYHNSYNLAAMSFTAGELAAEIKRHLPQFACDFQPDHRQAIADTWPRSLDDTAARSDWNWRPQYDLPRMAADMLQRLSARGGTNTG
jgi:nucleoside-diphosphate-sugar epimerase